MSEKRFELEISSFSGKHMKFLNILDNGKRLNSEEIVDLLNEQQSTISQLKKINKEISDDLHNCRLNKNIISEKLKLWQDVHKEYNIYSIKDFEELMKNDK